MLKRLKNQSLFREEGLIDGVWSQSDSKKTLAFSIVSRWTFSTRRFAYLRNLFTVDALSCFYSCK
jgi:hypothetical protein